MSITVLRAAPYLTVQDFGRVARREFGVPRCGAMDRFALGTANALVGNSPDVAGLEWALGGGSVRFETACTFALTGATSEGKLDQVAVAPLTATRAHDGSVLEIGRFLSGRFLYLSISGGVGVEELLGSRSTYLPARFGGFGGKLIRSGDALPVSPARTRAGAFAVPENLRADYSRRVIRVVPGPQWESFTESDRRLFFGQSYTISRASDRMGYRLEGTPLSAPTGLLPSEAVCEGTIQVPPSGLPIVLMADAPTVGGYPKIGVVETSDIPILAQLNPGDSFRFEESSVHDAQRRLRRSAASLFTLTALAAKS